MLKVLNTASTGKLAELTFVGTLPQLLVVRSLLYDVQNGVGQLHKLIRLSKLNGIELAQARKQVQPLYSLWRRPAGKPWGSQPQPFWITGRSLPATRKHLAKASMQG